MFVVIYQFDIVSGKQADFETAWHELTLLIIKHEGGLGSRLHKKNEMRYLAYAQWPEKIIWKESGSKLPDSAKVLKQIMQESCELIKVLFELEVVDDLLKK